MSVYYKKKEKRKTKNQIIKELTQLACPSNSERGMWMRKIKQMESTILALEDRLGSPRIKDWWDNEELKLNKKNKTNKRK